MKVRVVYGRHELSPDMQRWKTYTYECDEDVRPGDVVQVPPSIVSDTPQIATVVALGSDYNGPLKSVMYVVQRSQ